VKKKTKELALFFAGAIVGAILSVASQAFIEFSNNAMRANKENFTFVLDVSNQVSHRAIHDEIAQRGYEVIDIADTAGVDNCIILVQTKEFEGIVEHIRFTMPTRLKGLTEYMCEFGYPDLNKIDKIVDNVEKSFSMSMKANEF